MGKVCVLSCQRLELVFFCHFLAVSSLLSLNLVSFTRLSSGVEDFVKDMEATSTMTGPSIYIPKSLLNIISNMILDARFPYHVIIHTLHIYGNDSCNFFRTTIHLPKKR